MNASGRKLITDFFVLPLNQNKEPSEPPVSESSSACKARVARSISARKRSIPSHFGGIPEWMCIPGTKFRVVCSTWILFLDNDYNYVVDVNGLLSRVSTI